MNNNTVSCLRAFALAYLVFFPPFALFAATYTDGPHTYTYATSGGNAIITGYSGPGGAVSIPAAINGYSVTVIDDYAFSSLASLTVVTLPASVTHIGDAAFYDCTALTSVTILGNVNLISYSAFSDCTALTSVLITGNRPITVQPNAFNGTPVALIIYYLPSTTGWTPTLAGKPTKLIPLTHTSDGTQVTIKGLTDTSYAGHLLLPPALNGLPVTIIDSYAFRDCASLTSVTIPNGVVYIFSDAFRRCFSLTSATIPDSVIGIHGAVFETCTSLTNITVSGNKPNPRYGDINGVLFDLRHTTLIQYPGGRSGPYTIPDVGTAIGDYAFQNCTSLKSVTIPGSVTNIGDSAFRGCSSLVNAIIGNGVTTIGDFAFEDCTALTNAIISNGDIGTEAFDGCVNLATVTIGNGVTAIGKDAFSNCSSLKSVTIPGSVTNIGLRAFYGCTNLVNAIIVNGVTAISDSAFSNCSSLKSVSIPGSVTAIGESAFYSCKSLASVIVPASVTFIGDYAFAFCDKLTDVYFCGNAPNTGGDKLFFNTSAIVYRMAGKTGWPPKVPNLWQGCPTALWDGPPPPPPPPAPPVPADYLCAPAGDAEFTAVGSYDGYFYATEAFGKAGNASAVRGTFFLKVTSLAGKLTAKATLQGGNVSFKGAVWRGREADGTQRAELTASGGEKLDLFVRQNRIWGTLTGGRAGATALTLDGARNRFADHGDTGAAALLETFRGYYTIALPAVTDGAILAPGGVDAAPQGAGYLAVTIGNKGSAKIAGILADGTKVSRSSRLILFDGCGPEACVPLFAPLYSKRGWAGGLLWIDPATRTVETDRDLGWFIRWENPGRVGPDGFSLLLDACGGFYGTGAALAAAYRFGVETNGTAFFDTSSGALQAWAVQPKTTVTAAGNRMTITKGAKPKKVSEEGATWYEYDPANPANASFSFASRTGIFKGKFSLYSDYEDATGKLILKAVSVPYAGVLAPVRGKAFKDLPAGLGYCLIPDNDPAVRAFRLKRSRPVWLEEQ